MTGVESGADGASGYSKKGLQFEWARPRFSADPSIVSIPRDGAGIIAAMGTEVHL